MINRLSHAELAVTDLDRAHRFYVEVLGLVVHESSDRALWLKAADEFDVWTLKLTLVHAADVLSDAGFVDAIELGPGRHGATDAFFLYIKDPDGTRIELYAGDYVRDLDRPPVVWDADEYAARGLLWWGRQPPASFRQAGPVLERGRVGEPTLTGVSPSGSPA